MKEIIAANPELVHECTEGGDSVVHLAVDSGDEDILSLILATGAEVDTLGEHGWTPLYSACIGYANLCPLLLEAGADINGRNGFVPLHAAAMFQGPITVENLLQRGADIDAIDKDGYTALHAAYDDSNPRPARHLWDRGARRDVFGAAALGEMSFLRTALEADPEMVEVTDGLGRTPLHWACRGGQTDVTRFLLDLGCPVNARKGPEIAYQGVTALHLAARWSELTTLKMLIQAGARLDARDSLGRRPHDIANQMSRDGETIAVLLLS
ncbi:MAG: ankyrin repeat domain-containing protein [Singulisphaera sp.]